MRGRAKNAQTPLSCALGLVFLTSCFFFGVCRHKSVLTILGATFVETVPDKIIPIIHDTSSLEKLFRQLFKAYVWKF